LVEEFLIKKLKQPPIPGAYAEPFSTRGAPFRFNPLDIQALAFPAQRHGSLSVRVSRMAFNLEPFLPGRLFFRA
jgi:hypothetical protein